MPSDYKAITEYNERQLGLDTASRKTQISMYSDPTHFIYELLQNADDYGATEIFFSLSKNELVIEHDGRPFTDENVKAITYFGKSTSADDLVKTGRFGVGFKSVFAFTATPIVISGDEHFQIHGLYRIKEYSYPSGFSHLKTRIILPFNHTSEQPDYVDELITEEDAYTRISKRLVGLNMDALLFTQNIREIRWEIEGRSGHYLREDIIEEELRRTTIADSGERLNEYLIFSKVPEWKGQKHKAVEIAFLLDKKGQIAPVENDYLYVLFATTQETHLQFILNGPFRTNPSRETISEEDAFNKYLMSEICLLMKKLLPLLRDKRLMSTQVLSVLPNNNDKLRDFYEPLMDGIVETFHDQSLIPTDDNQYAYANNVFQGPAPIREVITKNKLSFFIDNEDAHWAKGVQQNSRADYFLQSLNIQHWGWQELKDGLVDRFSSYSFEDDEAWLASRSDVWLQKLYLLLADSIKREKCSKDTFDSCHIIRVIESGIERHTSASKSYFPKKGYRNLPQIKAAILRGKSDNATEKVGEALVTLGVSSIGKEERIDVLLETFYKNESSDVSAKQHLKHMNTFIDWWQKQKNASKFNDYAIFYSSNDSKYYKPKDCFLDLPFEDTGLEGLFKSCDIKTEKRKHSVWPEYDDIDGFHEFAKAVGVMRSLEIRSSKATKMQNRIFPKVGKETNTTIDKDYFINGLGWFWGFSNGYLGGLSLAVQDIELSRAVWLTMCHADNMWRYAHYLPNNAHRDREKISDSFLCNQLKSCAWVPDKEGHFLYPRAVTRESLHPDFPMDNIYFLKAIEFGSDEEKAIEENKLRQESNINAAKQLGISIQDIPILKDMKNADPETRADIQRRLNQGKAASEFPEKTPKNPERRKCKIQGKVNEAPNKKTEAKKRSVNTSKVEIDAQSYLRNLYTNTDGVLICQLCNDPMPFKKDDGEYYMEAVEIKGSFSKEMEQLYLALCPNCSAKYKYFIKRHSEVQEQVTAEIRQTESTSLSLSLGESNATLRFVETHLADLKAILEKLDADHD